MKWWQPQHDEHFGTQGIQTIYSRPVGAQLEHIIKSFPAFGSYVPRVEAHFTRDLCHPKYIAFLLSILFQVAIIGLRDFSIMPTNAEYAGRLAIIAGGIGTWLLVVLVCVAFSMFAIDAQWELPIHRYCT